MDHDRTLTCERVIDALDDYLDSRQEPTARAAVDAHLDACPACRTMAADVRALRATARTLEPIEPPAHVWHAVRERVAAETPARRSLLERLGFSFAGPWGALQPLAAAAGLVLVVSSLSWVGAHLTAPSATPPVAAGAGQLAEFQLAEAEYTDAIDRLEEATTAARPRLDTITSETLQAGIDDIDMAIGDAREALMREPGDALSQESLLDALSSKVALLQDTVALLGDVEPATEAQTP